MNAVYSEDYYKAHWDEFIKPVPGNHYMNLEKDLFDQINAYEVAMAEIPES